MSVVFFSALGFGAAFAAAGFGSFFASLVPPELPVKGQIKSYKEKMATRTLWLSEDTLLDTSLEGSVEQRIEHGICGVDLVVGSNILLEGDAAGRELAWLR